MLLSIVKIAFMVCADVINKCPSIRYGSGMPSILESKQIKNLAEPRTIIYNEKQISTIFEYLNNVKIHLPNKLLLVSGAGAFV